MYGSCSMLTFQVYFRVLCFATTLLPPLFPTKGCSGEVKGTRVGQDGYNFTLHLIPTVHCNILSGVTILG